MRSGGEVSKEGGEEGGESRVEALEGLGFVDERVGSEGFLQKGNKLDQFLQR